MGTTMRETVILGKRLSYVPWASWRTDIWTGDDGSIDLISESNRHPVVITSTSIFEREDW